MLSLLLTASTLLAPQGLDHDDILINEFSYDDTGTDDREFVELYNAGTATVDLTGWILKSSDSGGLNLPYPVLPGTMLAPGGYWVMGSALVPGVNQVIGVTNIFENDNESLWIEAPDGDISDAVLYESNKGIFSGANVEGGGIWGNFTSTDGFDSSWSRVRDGRDTDDNGRDFVLNGATSGAANDRTGPFPFLEDFDAMAPETPIPQFPNSNGLVPYSINPTALSTHNPIAIPPSYDGGNACAFWDPALSQNPGSWWFGSDNSGQTVFTAQVYLDPTLKSGTGSETWCIGIGGTTDPFFNIPDPSGSLGTTANGNTGVAWIYQVTATAATLYLVDHGDGGWGGSSGPVVIHQEAVTAGVNDGWQELRLSVADGKLLAHRGHGLLNCCKSLETEISADVTLPDYMGVYVGYRGSLAGASEIRPLIMDKLAIRSGSGRIFYSGQPSPTTFATPALTCSNPPVIGQASWAVQMSGLTPSNLAVLLAGSLLSPPTALGPLGGPPTSFIYVNAIMYLGLTPDPLGNANAPLVGGVPCNNTLVGVPVYWQTFTADPNLPYLFFVGNSNTMETQAGF